MPTSVHSAEPYHVSARFRLALRSAIVALEAAAAEDEHMLAQLDDADHRRRQQLLVDSELTRAFQLNELLGRTALRADEPSRASAGAVCR